ILAETEAHFDLLGLTLDQWRDTNRFKEKILAKASAGCKVRFLLMHQENPVLESLFRGNELNKVRGKIVDSADALSQIQAMHKNVDVRQLRTGIAYFSLTRSDRFVVLTQYLSSGNWGYGPTWRCAPKSSLFEAAIGEFEHLWNVCAQV